MKAFNTTLLSITLAFGALGVYAQAPSSDNQDQQPGHWRKATDQPAAPQSVQQTAAQQRGDDSEDRAMSNPDDGQNAPPAAENEQDQGPPPPANRSWQNGPGQPPVQGGQQRQWSRFGDRPMPMARPRQPMPPTLTLQAGTWVSFRVNQPMSSDHNQQGDAFMGTLAEPLVVNGMVIARRGQTVSGRVVEAQKAGRVSGTSKLGIELTEIALADGQQITVHTQMAERRGGTSYGRDAAAIGTTTAAGALIGAGVNGGVGAGVGAAGGLVASTVGVLLTRGKQTVLYPEQVLTFRLVNPVTVAADFNGEAFQAVSQQDYQQSALRTYSPQRYSSGPGYYGGYYGYGYPNYGPYYYGSYYPWYWGPSLGFGLYGGGYYGGGYYRGGGYHGGGNHGGGGGNHGGGGSHHR